MLTSRRLSCSSAGNLGRRSEHAEAGAVDEDIAIQAAVGQRGFDGIEGVRGEQVDWKGGRARAVRRELCDQSIERLAGAADQQQE